MSSPSISIYIYTIYIHLKAIGDVGILSLAKVHQLNILIILNINWSAVFLSPASAVVSVLMI